jgi:hypothetical protein
VLINPISRTRTRHFRHAYHPTRDNIIIIAGHAGDYRVDPLNAMYNIATQENRMVGRRENVSGPRAARGPRFEHSVEHQET